MIRPLFVGRTDGRYECVAKDTKGKTIRKGFRLTVKAGNAYIAIYSCSIYISNICLLSIDSGYFHASTPF